MQPLAQRAHPRPHAPRLLVVVLLTALLLATNAAPALGVGGSEFVSRTNQYRASVGLAPLALNSAVDRIAVERANRMASARLFAHDMDYVKLRLAQLGVCWTRVAEIIAWESGYPSHSYARTMQGWWSSEGHHAQIVGDFNAAGGSWAVGGDGRTYSAMVFVKTCPSQPNVVGIGRATLASGSHTAYRFSGAQVVGRMTATLSRASGAEIMKRAQIGGRTYLEVGNGIFAGYWLAESARAYLPGWRDLVAFAQPMRITFDAGTHTGYRYYSSGYVDERLTATLPRASGSDASHRAVINGRPHFRVVNGIWAGYWVPDTSAVRPAS